jgi:hypothetical protein
LRVTSNSRDSCVEGTYPVTVALGVPLAPIPAFDSRGLLPPYIGPDGATADRSPYEATMTEIVPALGTTPHRRSLVRGLLDYRALLTRLGYTVGLQFLNGTFVENVEGREGRPPNDY